METTKVGTANGRTLTGWIGAAKIHETTDDKGKVTGRRLFLTPAIDPTTGKPGANLYDGAEWKRTDVRLTTAETDAMLAAIGGDKGLAEWIGRVTVGRPHRIILPAVAVADGRVSRTRVAVTDDMRTALLAESDDDDATTDDAPESDTPESDAPAS